MVSFVCSSIKMIPPVRRFLLYESTKRGLYSGSIGYIKPNKDFDFNVVIRSIIYDKLLKEINVSVGSAITFKSDPESEFEECLLKAEPMIKSLK